MWSSSETICGPSNWPGRWLRSRISKVAGFSSVWKTTGSSPAFAATTLEQWVMDAVFGHAVHPLILPFYEEVVIDERRVAVITVTQGVSKPYVVRHRGREDIYIRVGSTSRLATREQQARLFDAGGLIQTESLPVSGSRLDDLSMERLTDYLTRIVGDRETPTTSDAWHERLCALGLMVDGDAPVCSVAGLLLFGYRPRRLVRQAGVRWMCFAGREKTYEALDDQVFEGPSGWTVA